MSAISPPRKGGNRWVPLMGILLLLAALLAFASTLPKASEVPDVPPPQPPKSGRGNGRPPLLPFVPPPGWEQLEWTVEEYLDDSFEFVGKMGEEVVVKVMTHNSTVGNITYILPQEATSALASADSVVTASVNVYSGGGNGLGTQAWLAADRYLYSLYDTTYRLVIDQSGGWAGNRLFQVIVPSLESDGFYLELLAEGTTKFGDPFWLLRILSGGGGG
jgi:hypothetical protein